MLTTALPFHAHVFFLYLYTFIKFFSENQRKPTCLSIISNKEELDVLLLLDDRSTLKCTKSEKTFILLFVPFVVKLPVFFEANTCPESGLNSACWGFEVLAPTVVGNSTHWRWSRFFTEGFQCMVSLITARQGLDHVLLGRCS